MLIKVFTQYITAKFPKRAGRLLLCLFLFAVSVSQSDSQGFNWQYSSRMPSTYPFFYIGAGAEGSYLIHNGYIRLTEGYSECCTFENGTGKGTSYGIFTEYWKGLWAITGNISYAINPGNFLADGLELPRRMDDGTIYKVRYENEFVSSMSYLFFELGAKYRILKSHFYVGGALKFGVLIDEQATQYERIVSPAEERFADGSQQQTLFNGKISEIRSYAISPRIRLGYDLPLSLGVYASPNISLGLPVINVAKYAEWQTWSFNVGISIFKDIKKN